MKCRFGPGGLLLEARALSVPLRDPFVIATTRIEATQSVLVNARLSSGEVGLGEAAALPGVTREDQASVLFDVAAAVRALEHREFTDVTTMDRLLDVALGTAPVARAGVETAILDALAKAAKVPFRRLLGPPPQRTDPARALAAPQLVTDITIPILEEARMVELAREWRAKGFTCFKVKVGKNADADVRALAAIHAAVPDATFRIDANEGFTAKDAIRVARDIEKRGLVVECYEQPCAADDLDAMAEVAAELETPVVADESVATLADLERVLRAHAADGINLKLAKSGGPLAAYALGLRARAAGMKLMVGGMVETRLGMTAAAHVAAALGGVDYVDLDTAWLLASERFAGGYKEDGPRYTLDDKPGLGVTELDS